MPGEVVTDQHPHCIISINNQLGSRVQFCWSLLSVMRACEALCDQICPATQMHRKNQSSWHCIAAHNINNNNRRLSSCQCKGVTKAFLALSNALHPCIHALAYADRLGLTCKQTKLLCSACATLPFAISTQRKNPFLKLHQSLSTPGACMRSH